MSLKKFAENELNIAGYLSQDDFYGGETGKAVLELIEVFSKQGHSGMSATIVADLFWKLANYKPLSSIIGEDSEWESIEGIASLQNKRCPSLWKDSNGVITYGRAIVFENEDGSAWTGSCWLTEHDCLLGEGGKKVKSSQKIKGFPFTPKTFRIKVKNVGIGDEIHPVIKHLGHLDEVKSHYILS